MKWMRVDSLNCTPYRTYTDWYNLGILGELNKICEEKVVLNRDIDLFYENVLELIE